MSNHPNRSGRRTAASTPRPAEVRQFREARKLTVEQCAALVHSTATTWRAWEIGEKVMHPAFLELATIKADRKLPEQDDDQ